MTTISETKTKNRSQIVTTISGKEIEREKCKKILKNGEPYFHEIGVDCFLIGDKYVSKHFNRIEIDQSTGEYFWISKMGNIVTDVQNSELIFGYSTDSYPIGFKDYNNKQIYCLNKEIYNKVEKYLVECPFTGEVFFKKSPVTKPMIFNPEQDCYNNIVSSKTAKIRNYSAVEKTELGIESKTFQNTGGLSYTWGIEMEMSDGKLSKNEAINNNLNILVTKDGSLTSNEGRRYGGGEIVTGVFTGDAGIEQLKKITSILEKRCLVNQTCSTHVHVGVQNPSDEFTVYAYALGLALEKSLNTLLPHYRRTTSNQYCRGLKVLRLDQYSAFKQHYVPEGSEKDTNKSMYRSFILQQYRRIFYWLSGGNELSPDCNRKFNHPKGNKCGYDHSTPRYCWLNLIPCNFNTRGNNVYTIEVRNFSETKNFTKIKNWLLLCLAFVYYIENKQSEILKYVGTKNTIGWRNILSAAYSNTPKLLEELTKYFKEREYFFEAEHRKEEDFKCA